jgi:FkbM family methyltransferase
MPDAATVPLAIPGLELRMRVHGQQDRHVSAALREQGQWEPFETSLLRRYLKPGDRVLDAGANIGYFTLVCAACVGDNGRVYAFEPEPCNYRLLTDNVALNRLDSRVIACEAALADADGDGQLYLNPDNLGDHQLHEEVGGRRRLPVKLVAGAAWFEGRESQLDMVKIDVQGAEYAVVRGLLPLLAASGSRLHMLVELTPLSLRAAGSSGRALLELLATLGLPFHIVDHVEHRLVATDVEALATWCDNVDACPGDAGFMNIFLGQQL